MKAPLIALIVGLAITGAAAAQGMQGGHGGMGQGAQADRPGEQAQDRTMGSGKMKGRMGMHDGMGMQDGCPMMHSGMMRDGMGSGMMGGGMGRGGTGSGGMMRGGMMDSDMMRGGTGGGDHMSGLFGTRVRPMMNISVDDVRGYLGNQLERLNNKRLKVGTVNAEGNTITADVVTVDNSLVQQLKVDRQTGRIEYVE